MRTRITGHGISTFRFAFRPLLSRELALWRILPSIFRQRDNFKPFLANFTILGNEPLLTVEASASVEILYDPRRHVEISRNFLVVG
jgi:hypothetical protein